MGGGGEEKMIYPPRSSTSMFALSSILVFLFLCGISAAALAHSEVLHIHLPRKIDESSLRPLPAACDSQLQLFFFLSEMQMRRQMKILSFFGQSGEFIYASMRLSPPL